MNTKTKDLATVAVALRLVMGWFMFVDGLHLLRTPHWTAKTFLLHAKTFPHFYAWFALPMNTWWVDPLNSWGITFIGIALLLGVGTRVAAWAAAIMMIVYYFPHYAVPYVSNGGFIVEEHIIYAVVFVLIAIWPRAQRFAFGPYLRRRTVLGRIPLVKQLL